MPHKERKNPLIYLWSKTWRYSAGNRKKIICFWIMFVLAITITLFIQPLTWAKIINTITEQGITRANINMLFGLLSIIFLIDFVFWSLHGPARVMESRNAFKARVNYRKHLLKGVLTLPMGWHTDHHSGDTIDKVEKGTSALMTFSEYSSEIIYALVEFIGSFVMLAYLSPPSALIVFGIMLATTWIVMRFDRVLINQYRELNHAENHISEKVFDAISNITTVIILRVERLVFNAIMHKVEKPFDLFKKNSRLNECKWFLTSVCCSVMTLLVLGTYLWQHVGTEQGILIGSVYLVINYLRKVGDLFFKFTGLYGEILQRKAKVMNSEELSKDFMPQSFTNHVLPKDWQYLEVQDLNFSYHNEEQDNLHLDNISMLLKRGERIALVGETGSGKTTLLKVMRDLYRPKSLTLAVDGKVITQGFEGISRAISLVPQNPEIFATTIMENITLGAEHDINLVRRVTNMACFTSVAESLPRKFDTSIKEKGVNLSGGQQQRLALARGLLACMDKDIVLLDEPTSSLDAATEMKVFENIFKEFKDKAIIATIHRLHLLPLFDKIYMFEEGSVVGSGTLSELLSSSPKFQALWQKSLAVTDPL